MADHRPAPGEPRSRLDPEPVARRDFLGLAAAWSALAAMAFAGLGIARLPKAAVLASPSRKFRVALPESLAPGEPFVPPGRPVALFRDAVGVYAISMVCTHLGCIVHPMSRGFDCPCHGSRFDGDGGVLRGPAPKGLSWFLVSTIGEHEVLVDTDTTVPAGTRVVL